MPLIAAHKLDVSQGDTCVYNGLDACLTHEIDSALARLGRNDTTIYDFERAMQAPALEMMLRGFRVDPAARQIAQERTRAKLDATLSVLNKLAQGIWDKDINPGSRTQLQDLFYNHMGIPPITLMVKGVLTKPMDRKVLEKLEAYFYARPIVLATLLARDLIKTLQVLETEIDSDWRWRCSYNIAGTNTGRWSSSKGAAGTGCVLPSTEALTVNGWRRIDSIRIDDFIAQYNPTENVVEFARCSNVMYREFSGNMLQVSGEQIKQTLTPNHRVLWLNSRMNDTNTTSAEVASTLSQEVIPLGGRKLNGILEMPRYAAMLMADFSVEQPGWRGAFKKERKIQRFLSLAKEFGLDYYEQAAKPDYRRFAVRGCLNIPKKWGSWVLDLTPESAEDLLDEARHWDATDRGSGFIFFTVDEEQATWFATLAHLTGRSATKRLIPQNEGSYGTNPIWWVNVKNRCHARIQRKFWKTFPYEGKVYCPTVPSGYWLMREDGFISVTGNSNFQNITDELRRIFIADEGWKLCGLDLEQAEAREVGWFCGTILGDWSYLDMIEAGDPHTYVARLCWPELPWTGDIKADRKIAERKFYRWFTYRDATKRLSHGSNYMGKPYTMSINTKIPQAIVTKFQERYFTSFPCITQMHHWIAGELQTKQYLVNAFGRRRDFFDRPNEHDTLKGAVAYMFQSATGDRLNLGLWRIWKHMGTRVQVLAQLHDALYFQYRLDDNEAEVIGQARKLMHIPLTHKLPNGAYRVYTIPSDATTGFNWSHRYRLREDGTPEDWNPKGLDKYRPN